MPAVSSTGDALSPLIVIEYEYMKRSSRKFPKDMEHVKFIKKPYVIRFSESGFVKSDILIEYFELVVQPWIRR